MKASLKKSKIEAILASLEVGTSFIKACKAADVNQATFWKWRQKSKPLDERVLEILNSRTQTVEDALFSNAVKGNVTAQIFWLKNRAPDRWKDRYEQQLGGEVKIEPLKVVISKDDS